MQIGNVTKAATFKTLLHQSYKSTQLLFLWQSFLVIFSRRFFGATQNLELHFSFKPTTLLKVYSKMVIFWENFEIFEKATSSITEAYFESNQKSIMDFLWRTVKPNVSIVDIWRVLNTSLHYTNFSCVLLFQYFRG